MNNETKIKEEPRVYQALLDELLSRTSQALLLLNENAEIILCSQGIKLITGFETQELVGKTVFDFFHPNDTEAANRQHQYLATGNKNAFASVVQVRNKFGHLIWVDAEVKNMLRVPEIGGHFVLIKRSCDASDEEKKLAKAVTDAKEQEREFLATELHDNVNQIITATKLLVEAARFHPNKEELLHLSATNLQLAGDEIRKLSYSMVSYDVRTFGLDLAVKTFVDIISRASAIKFQINFDEKALDVLDADQQLHLYRILQEATNNIVRHAKATLATITLNRNKGLVSLVISDNGTGFSMSRLKPGIGLASITNRVKILGGHFHVRCPQGEGTTIEIHLPV